MPSELAIRRVRPESVADRSPRTMDATDAVNQISLPLGDQAIPCTVGQGPERTFLLPARSIRTREPVSSPRRGWSIKATRSPLRETRGLPIHPEVNDVR